jgi:hypothetical protein
MQLHKDPELGERQAGGFRKMHPVTHGPMHGNVNELAKSLDELRGSSHG